MPRRLLLNRKLAALAQALILGAASHTALAECTGKVVLDFDDGRLPPCFETRSETPDSMVTLRDGGLLFSRPAGLTANSTGSLSMVKGYEIRGDFDIEADFDLQSFSIPSGDEFRYACLYIWDACGGDYVGIERLIAGRTSPCVPYTNVYKLWMNTTHACVSKYVPTSHTRGKLRVVRVGTRWTFHHWDRSGWVLDRTVTATTRPVGVTLYVGGNSTTAQTVRFDSLVIRGTVARIEPGQPACAPANPTLVPADEACLRAAESAAARRQHEDAWVTAAGCVLGISRADPDTAFVDRAGELMLGVRVATAAKRRDAGAVPVRADTVEAIQSVEEYALRLREASQGAAGRMLERCLELRARVEAPQDLRQAEATHALAGTHFQLGDYQKSIVRWEQARLAFTRLQGPHGDAHRSESNLALAHLQLGELSESRQAMETLITDLEERHPDRGVQLSTIYLNLGEVYTQLGEDPQVIVRTFERCIELRRAAGLGREWLGDPLASLAATYAAAGDPGRALVLLDSLEKAFAIRPDQSNIGGVQLYRAHALRSVGRLDEADSMARSGHELLTRTWGTDHPELIDSYLALAQIGIEKRAWSRAGAAAESAVAMGGRWLPGPHPDQGRTRLALAQARFGSGDRAAAFVLAIDAERRLREALRDVGSELSEGAAFRIDGDRALALGVAASCLGPSSPAADRRALLDAVVRSRAQILDLRVARVLAAGADSLGRRLRDDYARACTRVANLAMRKPAPKARVAADEIEKALTERRRAERALAAHSVPFLHQRERDAAGLGEVLEARPAGSAMVCFLRYAAFVPGADRVRSTAQGPERYAALIARHDGEPPAWVTLGDARDIDALVEGWRRAVARGSGDSATRRAGEALRRAVWDPIAIAAAGASSLVLVPDGTLQTLNFGALPLDKGRYVMEAGPRTNVLGAERDLVRSRDPRDGRGLLALGGVDYDRSVPAGNVTRPARSSPYRSARASCGTFEALRLEPLPASMAEVTEVASIWRGGVTDATTEVLTGETASEDRFKRMASGFRFLHLATHGFFLASDCDSTTSRRGTSLLESPLLRSGLALSGFNLRLAAAPNEEDGVLTAEEIAALDLSGVDCVVLSACESGVGVPTAGEGVLGLRRAFQAAGAQTLVTSLWPVQDHVARAWMRAFYEHYAYGRSPADAATEASRAMLTRLRTRTTDPSPADWGAFIVVGGAW